MYFWTQEIDKIDNNIVTLKNGSTITVEEKNKELFTEKASTASELQEKWSTAVAKEIIDVLHSNNVRLTDINWIITLVNDIVWKKNEEAVANAFGRDNLDVLTNIFGAEKAIPELAVRNIRIKDIFKS